MTYGASAVLSMLRQRARDRLAELEPVISAMHVALDWPARVELTSAFAELRRLLHGDVPPEARPADPKVRPLRVAATPKFKKRSLLTSDCYAAGDELPPDGPEAA